MNIKILSTIVRVLAGCVAVGGTGVAPGKFGVASNLLAGFRFPPDGGMRGCRVSHSVSGATPETTGRRPVPPGILLTRAIAFILFLAATTVASAQQTNLSSGLNFDKFKLIAERNIFNQSREPHERAVPPPRVPDSFSLVGTLLYAGGDIAFFNGTSDAYRKALEVGGDIAGFKVTNVTLNSVTLADGTNQTVLKITTQMRRDDDGHWSVSTEPVAYSSVASSSGAVSERTSSSHSRHHFSTPRNALTTTNAAPAGTASSGGSGSALERLMQRRAQQEKQLRQGQ